jgi:predicted metal-dependent hydrolase
VWFEWVKTFRKREPATGPLLLGSRRVRLLMVRHPRARRYLLRLRPDGTARVTIPRGGSAAAARQFVERNRAWLERQIQQWQAGHRRRSSWQVGSKLWLRGECVQIQSDLPG